jgi:hypothetical protein
MPAPISRAPKAANIIKTYRSATPEELKAGLDWYRAAHAEAVRLDPDNPDRAAGVVAALSPQTNWPRNLELAARAYRNGYASGTLSRSCARADAIFAGANPLDVLSGPKTRAFYRRHTSPMSGHHMVCLERPLRRRTRSRMKRR